MKLALEDISYSTRSARAVYHYALYVSDSTALRAGEAHLHLRGMGGVLAQGDAPGWRNAGFTETSASWRFAQEVPDHMTRFAYFDVVADTSRTKPGPVQYEVETGDRPGGEVGGPVTASPQPEVIAYAFFDADRDGLFDDNEIGLSEVAVTLTGDATTTLDTDGDGLAEFGAQAEGSYSIEVTGDGGYGLFDYWTATTPTSQSFEIDAATESPVVVRFGFYPEDIGDYEVIGANRSPGFWTHNVQQALKGRSNGTQVAAADLLGYLAEVEALGPYDEPFDLGDSKLEGAYSYLHPRGSRNSPMVRLYRQLLAAELNWVSGRTSSMPKLEAMVLWYGEYVANEDQAMAGTWAEVLDAWNNPAGSG
ncbi:MAG: SdrD B-like domain-containing protein [Armatimonadota bacterium]